MTPFSDPFRPWPRTRPFTKGRHAERHLAALQAVLADPPPDPGGGGEDRGILFVGGGAYWPGCVVAVNLIRRLGCAYPVEVWYRSSCEAVRPADVRGMGVSAVDADAVAAALGDSRVPRGRGASGFEAKLYALAHCGFRQTLYLDMDAYPVAAPCGLFDALDAAPFAYWEDVPGMAATCRWHKVWPAGVTSAVPPVQAGHLLFDRSRGWPLLAAAHWMSEHSDFYYQHGRDDQDALRVGLEATGTAYHRLGQARRVGPALVCDRGDKPVVVHRVAGKLFPGTTPPRDDRLPLEREVFELFAGLEAPPAVIPVPPPDPVSGCCG